MHLVIIDDSQFGCGTQLRNLLEELGHDADHATDPKDAIDLIDDTVDSVFVGLNLRNTNSISLARTIERTCGVQVAFFGFAEPEQSHKLVVSRQFGLVLPSAFTSSDAQAVLSRLPCRTPAPRNTYHDDVSQAA